MQEFSSQAFVSEAAHIVNFEVLIPILEPFTNFAQKKF